MTKIEPNQIWEDNYGDEFSIIDCHKGWIHHYSIKSGLRYASLNTDTWHKRMTLVGWEEIPNDEG